MIRERPGIRLCLFDSELAFQKHVSGRSHAYLGDIDSFQSLSSCVAVPSWQQFPKSNWTGQQLKLDLHVKESLYNDQADKVYFPIRTENLLGVERQLAPAQESSHCEAGRGQRRTGCLAKSPGIPFSLPG